MGLLKKAWTSKVESKYCEALVRGAKALPVAEWLGKTKK